MARPKDSVIEDRLRKVVRTAVRKDEDITVRQARSIVEKELGLEDGFLLDSDEWKSRSKAVIHDAFSQDSSGEDEPTPDTNTRANPLPNRKPVTKSKPQSNASKAPSSAATARKGAKGTLPNERVDEDESSEGESDHSQEKDSIIAAQKQPQQPVQVNGVKRKVRESSESDEETSSDDSSSSEASDDAEASPKKKARKDESSSSDEESEDSSEGESDEDNKSREGSRSPGEATQSATKSIPAIPPKQFVSPPGFTLIDAGNLRADAALSLSSIEGKQLWHITAPSNLPLSSLTEVSLDALRAGQPLFNRDGIEYVVNEQLESNIDAPSLLLATENGYQLQEQGIERSLHLQQKIVLPSLTIRQADQNAGSSAAAQVNASPISHPKPQPKGLRMRYKPPGSGSGKPGILGSDSDSDDNTENVASVNASTGLTQDVNAMVVDERETSKSSKKLKKKSKSTESGENGPPAVNGVPKSTSGSTKAATPSQPAMANGTPEQTVNQEERKRQKREQKEAKQKAKDVVR